MVVVTELNIFELLNIKFLKSDRIEANFQLCCKSVLKK